MNDRSRFVSRVLLAVSIIFALATVGSLLTQFDEIDVTGTPERLAKLATAVAC